MKILLITRRFFPHGDATSAIVYHLAQALLKKGAEVQVACLTSRKEDQEIRRWKNVDVIQLYRADSLTFDEVRKDLKRRGILAAGSLFHFAIKEMKKRLLPRYRNLSFNPPLVSGFEELVKKTIKDGNYDVCIVTMMPHEAVYAVMKHAGALPFVIYQLDSYWDNEVYPPKWKEQRLAFEKEAVAESLFVMTTPIIEAKDRQLFPEFSGRIIPAEFPMITGQKENTASGEGICRCVFLGTLYTDLRPPEKVVHVLSELNCPDMVFEFYGSRQDLIERCPKYEAAKSMIRLMGSVSSQEAEKIRSAADILVNIDNITLDQVPSKIFEYFCTGKPVINFYFHEESPALAYFRKYPLALNINVTQEKDAASRIQSFVREHRRDHLPFSEIRELFETCTPDFVADQFLDGCVKYPGEKMPGHKNNPESKDIENIS